jgi:hypothetical protein
MVPAWIEVLVIPTSVAPLAVPGPQTCPSVPKLPGPDATALDAGAAGELAGALDAAAMGLDAAAVGVEGADDELAEAGAGVLDAAAVDEL